jgi:hypothetical protein
MAAPQASSAKTAARPVRGNWATLLIRNVLLALIPVWLVWMLLTPVYNRFLLISARNLVRLTESPNVTDLPRRDTHFAYVQRLDFPPAKSLVHSFRVTDVHFHFVLLGALFLGVPRIRWRDRLGNFGWACLITVFFDIFLVFFYVKFVYATQLGDWSMSHYGSFARNFWGLGKHLMDLPFKLALPLVLWAAFYFEPLMGAVRGERE